MAISTESALTFDDVLLEPGYAGFLRHEVDYSSYLTSEIKLRVPLVSAPMDTVTESALATALAREGGIGIIHRNLSVDNQAAEVEKVKQEGLMVGAAIGASGGYEERVERLLEAGVDVLVVDSAHGYSKLVIDAVKNIKNRYKIQLIAGNVATSEGAGALIDAGADSLRVGMGPGAICSTRIVSGMGVPQIRAIMETYEAARDANIPIIADGGLVTTGDVVKALGAGASTVMFGRLFAATEESSGTLVELTADKVPSRFKDIVKDESAIYHFKKYRGMGSIGAMQQGSEISTEEEFHGKNYSTDTLVAEGVEGLVPCSGNVKTLVQHVLGGLVSGLYYTGARTIEELHEKATFFVVTDASLKESYPHDLFITDDGGSLTL